jgi:hypothetical protein
MVERIATTAQWHGLEEEHVAIRIAASASALILTPLVTLSFLDRNASLTPVH